MSHMEASFASFGSSSLQSERARPESHNSETTVAPTSMAREESDSEKEELDEGTKNFYRMIPEMRSLVLMLDSKRKKRPEDLGKVISRGANSALTCKVVAAAQQQRTNRKIINAGCGFDSLANEPYKPFGTCSDAHTPGSCLTKERKETVR
jgi:hypothetical protein